MARLLGTLRVRAPQQGARFIRDHPLAPDLGLWVPGMRASPTAVENLVTGKLTTASGTAPDAIVAGARGRALRVSGRSLSSPTDHGLITDITPALGDGLPAVTALVLFRAFDAPGSVGYGSPLNKNPWGFNFHHGNGSFQRAFSLKTAGAWQALQFPSPAVGEWVVWTGTWDGATQRIFVNGIPAGAASKSGAMDSYTAPLTLMGSEPSAGQGPFNGELAFAYVARRALPPSAVLTLSLNPWQLFA